MCEKINTARFFLYFVMWGMGGLVIFFFLRLFFVKKTI